MFFIQTTSAICDTFDCTAVYVAGYWYSARRELIRKCEKATIKQASKLFKKYDSGVITKRAIDEIGDGYGGCLFEVHILHNITVTQMIRLET